MTNQTQASTSNPSPKKAGGSLHLMSLIPVASYTATYHSLDMPAELHDALIDLFCDGRSHQCLNTRMLKT